MHGVRGEKKWEFGCFCCDCLERKEAEGFSNTRDLRSRALRNAIVPRKNALLYE